MIPFTENLGQANYFWWKKSEQQLPYGEGLRGRSMRRVADGNAPDPSKGLSDPGKSLVTRLQMNGMLKMCAFHCM